MKCQVFEAETSVSLENQINQWFAEQGKDTGTSVMEERVMFVQMTEVAGDHLNDGVVRVLVVYCG